MIYAGSVINVAVWDGVSQWDPVSVGVCDTVVDVTETPYIDTTYTYAGPTGWLATGGTFTAP